MSTSSVHATEPTVLCFGDSNTWGYDGESDGARFGRSVRWPGRLGEALHGRAYVVENGMNGRTSNFPDSLNPVANLDGSTHLPSVLSTAKPLHTVVIALGVNDVKDQLFASAEDIAAGIRKLVGIVKRSACGVTPDVVPNIVLVAPPAIGIKRNDWGFSDASVAKAVAVGDLVKAYAESEDGCVAVPSPSTAHTADGIHLDADGHKALAETVMGALKGL